jgi:hypothetical protein
VRSLADLNWEQVAADAARDMARGMLSKFQPCLPKEAEDRLLSERLLDHAGTLRFLATVKVNGIRIAARPTGMRLADVETIGPLTLELVPEGVPCATAVPKNDVQWVDTTAALRAVSEELRSADVLGLDCETTLDFGTLCLVQISTRQRTFLIDPLALGHLEPIVDVLSGAVPVKIIHNASFERRVLATLGITLR